MLINPPQTLRFSRKVGRYHCQFVLEAPRSEKRFSDHEQNFHIFETWGSPNDEKLKRQPESHLEPKKGV